MELMSTYKFGDMVTELVNTSEHSDRAKLCKDIKAAYNLAHDSAEWNRRIVEGFVIVAKSYPN